MIKSRSDYKNTIHVEKNKYFNGKKVPLYFMIPSEKYIVWKFQKRLRKTEYFYNTGKKIRAIVSRYILKRLSIKYGIQIDINCIDVGLHIFHLGNIVVNPSSVIGKNFTIIGECCIGKKGDSKGPIIGDNCQIGYNGIVIGNVRIGNNTMIGAGAVVTKDFIEEGNVLVGVPAKRK